MLEREGRVRGLRGLECWVEFRAPDGCAGCSGRCVSESLRRVKKPLTLKLPHPRGVELSLGDRIAVGLPERSLAVLSVSVYLVPLLSAFAGALVGACVAEQWNLFPIDIAAGGGAILGMVSRSARLRRSQRFWNSTNKPIILRRV